MRLELSLSQLIRSCRAQCSSLWYKAALWTEACPAGAMVAAQIAYDPAHGDGGRMTQWGHRRRMWDREEVLVAEPWSVI